MKFGCRAGARSFVFIGDTVERLRNAIGVDRQCPAAQTSGRVISKHWVITRIGGSINSRRLLGASAFLRRETDLLCRCLRREKERCKTNRQRRDPIPRGLLTHVLKIARSVQSAVS